MANEDIGKIYKELTDLAIDTNELQNDKALPNIIKKLDELKRTAIAYEGEVARILPVQLKFQIENLQALQNQIETVSKSVATNLTSLADVLTNIPWGKLVGASSFNLPKNLNTTTSNNTAVNTDANGVAPQEPLTMPATNNDLPPSDQAKSAMIQNESTFWNSLKNRFAESSMPGASTENPDGFSFSSMKESFAGMDFGLDELNTVQTDRLTVWEQIMGSVPNNDIDITRMAENQSISFGGHYVEDNEVRIGELADGSRSNFGHLAENMNFSGDKFDIGNADIPSGDDLAPMDYGEIDEGDSFSVVD